MVLVGSLQSFAEQAEALFVADPVKTRYILKYDHSKGKLHLKCTDDVSTVQYTTDQQSDLRKVDNLANICPHVLLSIPLLTGAKSYSMRRVKRSFTSSTECKNGPQCLLCSL